MSDAMKEIQRLGQEMDAELDLRRYGYAPGNYTCICVDCNEQHTADKRARRCKDCAIEASAEATTAETPTMRHEAYMDSERTFCRRCGAVEGTDAWAGGVCAGWNPEDNPAPMETPTMSEEYSVPKKARDGLVDAIMEALPSAYVGVSTREKWQRVVNDHFRLNETKD